jgi:hypothetical protein
MMAGVRRSFDMSTDTITIPVTPDVARAYWDASPELRRKWELILSLQLQEIIRRPRRTWDEITTELSDRAAKAGLTEAELDDILREWDEERKASRSKSIGSP